MTSTNFKDFYLALDTDQRHAFAARSKTTVGYIQTHLIYARKVPRKNLLDGLVAACADMSGPSRVQLIEFFYTHPAATPDEDAA